MTKLYNVWISAETDKQAKAIAENLLDKKLAVSATIAKTPSKFLWKGRKIKMDKYCYVQVLTIERHKNRIISEAEKISVEEVPMIFFFEFEANDKFTKWINKSLQN